MQHRSVSNQMSTEFYLKSIAKALERIATRLEMMEQPWSVGPVVTDPAPTMGYQEPLKGPHTCKCGTTNLWCPTHGYQGPHAKGIL